MENKRGKFIIIEGTDGSGKGTQTALLVQELKDHGYQVETIDFPRHGNPSCKLVDLYLTGFFGDPTKMDPMFISCFYAMDRYLHKEKIEKWLEEGRIVIADRYTTSNIGHQGAKISDEKEREKLFNWIYNFEFKEMDLPKPDLVLFIHVPTEIAFELIKKKNQRRYIQNSNQDGHEKNIEHLRAAESAYLHASKFFGWKIIECMENSRLLPIEDIHYKVWETVSGEIK